MRLTFLGTSAGVPTGERGLAAIALRFDDGRLWLVDCGEGTQFKLLASDLHPTRLERVLLTHLHGDHCFGLPGLLASLGVWGRKDPVEVVGPPGLRAWLEANFRWTATRLAFPLELRELPPIGGEVGTRGDVALEARPLVHRVASYAYVIREAERRGRLDVSRAEALGLKQGPLLGRLTRGESVTSPSGQRIHPSQVLGPERAGRTLVVCGDSSDSSALHDLAPGCDVLVHECTYDASREIQARRWQHSTTADVAALASVLQPRCLVLTHISGRYDSAASELDSEALRKEVEERCEVRPIVVARDGLSLEVPSSA